MNVVFCAALIVSVERSTCVDLVQCGNQPIFLFYSSIERVSLCLFSCEFYLYRPILVYLIEALSLKPRIQSKMEAYYGIEEASWQSLWTLMHGEGTDVSSLGARIGVLCFGFSALILGSSYTANLAAFLTIDRMNTINSIFDLTGLATVTVPLYFNFLTTEYPIAPTVTNITDIADVFEIGNQIVAGKYKAFLYDVEVLQYVVANFNSCSLRLLSELYHPFDYGLAFRANTSLQLVDRFSLQILEEQESGNIEKLRREYMMLDSECLTSSAMVCRYNLF